MTHHNSCQIRICVRGPEGPGAVEFTVQFESAMISDRARDIPTAWTRIQEIVRKGR